MKKFTVIARNVQNNNCIVITQIIANTRKEAQHTATCNYYQYLEPNEQMIVANERQWKEIWCEYVKHTDNISR